VFRWWREVKRWSVAHQRVSHSQYPPVPHPTTDNPNIPTDRTPAGSSTPSRKYSRWDNDDEEDIPTQPSPKRFFKPRHSKVSGSERSSPLSQPTRANLRPTPSSNKLHSACVPPRTFHPPIIPARSVFVQEVEPSRGGFVRRYLPCSRYTNLRISSRSRS
jgi:hypothetical protein